MTRRDRQENGKRRIPAWVFLLPFFLLLLFLLVYFLWFDRTAVTITVTGNDYYSAEELIERILPGALNRNTLYIEKFFDEENVDIPFIEDTEVEVIDHHTVSIRVYEKAFSGCVKYLGNYMYFDKDGIVIESNTIKRDNVPLISGIEFTSVRLGEQLPVDDPKIFDTILELCRVMNKYDCMSDSLIFNSDGSVSLGYGDIRVNIKDTTDIDRKILYMLEILPALEGKSGELDMHGFSSENDRIIFISD